MADLNLYKPPYQDEVIDRTDHLTPSWLRYFNSLAASISAAAPVFANPSAHVGIAAVNGIATTAMRSDAAPALDVSISPVWTGAHTFNQSINAVSGYRYNNTAPIGQYLRGDGTNFVSATIQSSDLPGSFSGFANPSASIGLTAVNGTASTAMRSDAAPALDLSISPTWTGAHTFTAILTASKGLFTSDFTLGSSALLAGSALVYNAGTGDMTLTPATFTLATAASLTSTLSVVGASTLTGSVGVGGASSAAQGLRVQPVSLATADQYGITSIATFNSSASSSGSSYYSQLKTAAASFTMANGYGIHIDSALRGSGSSITNLYGLKIEDQTAGATNYAIFTGLGPVRFGDATTIAGALSVSGSSTLSGSLTVGGPIGLISGSAVTSIAMNLVWAGTALSSINEGFNCSVTSGALASIEARAINAKVGSGAGSYTASATSGVYVESATRGSGSTITNNYGIYVESQTVGTNNYAIKTGLGQVQFGDVVRLGNAAALDDCFLINSDAPNNTNTLAGMRIQLRSKSAHTVEVSGAVINVGGANNISVTDVYGLQIVPGFSSGTGVFTNNYGLRIFDVTSGTNKWAIKTGLGAVEFGDNTTVTKNIAGNLISRIYNPNNTASAASVLEITAGGTSANLAAIQFDVAGSSNAYLLGLIPGIGALLAQTGAGGVAWEAVQGTTSGYANLSLFAPAVFNGADNVLFIGNILHFPTANPVNGGYMYVDAGALKWRGSSGTITTIAPA